MLSGDSRRKLLLTRTISVCFTGVMSKNTITINPKLLPGVQEWAKTYGKSLEEAVNAMIQVELETWATEKEEAGEEE